MLTMDNNIVLPTYALGDSKQTPLRKPFLRLQTAEEVHAEFDNLFRHAVLVRDARTPLMMYNGSPFPSAMAPGKARTIFATQLLEIACSLMCNEAQLYTLSLAFSLVSSGGVCYPGVSQLLLARIAQFYDETQRALTGPKQNLYMKNLEFLSQKVYDDSDKLLQVHTKTAILLETEERKRLSEIERSTDLSIFVLPPTVVRKGRQECRYLLLLPNGSQTSAGRRVKSAIQKIKAVSAEVKTTTNERCSSSSGSDVSPVSLSPVLSPFQEPLEPSGVDPEALALGMSEVSLEEWIPRDIFKEIIISRVEEIGYAIVDYSSIYSGGLFPGRPSKRARVNHLRFLLVVDDFARVRKTLRPGSPPKNICFSKKQIFFTYVKNSRSSERFRETLMDALDTVENWTYEGCEKGQGTSETICPAALSFLQEVHSNIRDYYPRDARRNHRILVFTCDAISLGTPYHDRNQRHHALCREVLSCLKDNIGVTICTWRNSIDLNLYGSIKNHYSELLSIVYLEDIMKFSDFMDFY